jgi:hypothetical protein
MARNEGKEESAEQNRSSRSAKGNKYMRRLLNQVALSQRVQVDIAILFNLPDPHKVRRSLERK